MRKIISTFIYLTKIFSRNNGIRMVMYHRVNDESPKDRLCVKTNEFRKQMGFLSKNNYEVITLEDACRQLSAADRQTNKPKIVITFDDGFEDNYINAYPILKEYGFAATIFLTAGFIANKEYLNAAQIQEMAKNKISFGAHSMTHPFLKHVPPETAKREIEESKIILSKLMSTKFVTFCYPAGDYNEEVKDLVKKAGFNCACSIKPGANFRGGDLFELKRTEISGFDSIFDFKKKLSGAYDLLHKLIQKHNTLYTIPNTKGRINVLYIIWSLGLGGAERVVIDLAKGLDKTKFNAIVACLNDKGEFADELEKQNIKVIALNKKDKFDIGVIKKIITIIRQHNIDIVHTHLWGANFWGRLAAKLAGKKVIITIHNVDIAHNKIELFFDKILAKFTDCIIAVGEEVKKDYCEKTGINTNKVKVIYNGITLTDLPGIEADSRILKSNMGIQDDDIVLSIIGRLVPQKGHQYLFDALGSLNGLYKVKLLVVGEGPEKQRLAQSVERLGLSNKVIFTGLRRDIEQILEISDIVVLPSLYEGIPIVILEAMAKKKPVIATDVGGNSELVISCDKPEPTGLLLPAADSKALVRSIETLIQNPKLRQSMGQAGYERLKKYFPVERMLKETQELYLNLIRSNENV